MLKFASTNKSLHPDWPLTYKIMPLHFDESVLREFCFTIIFFDKNDSMKKGSPRTYVR